MKSRITPWFLVAAICCLPALLPAQPAPAIQQFERTQREMPFSKPAILNLSTNTEAPELYPGENADVGPQRILRLKPRRAYFEIVADSQYLYTDNAFLSDSHKSSTALFVNTLQAAFAPEVSPLGPGQFAPSVGVRSQWFNYDLDGSDEGLSRLDFNAQTAFIRGRYQIRNWQFYGGFDFSQLLDQSRYEVQYREYVPMLGAQRFIPVNDKLMFALGAQIGDHVTTANSQNGITADVNDRYDCVANVSLSYEMVPRLVLQPYYRFQYTHYRHFYDNSSPMTTHALSRVDFVHTVGGSLAYYLNQNSALRIFISYEAQDSNYPTTTFDYHKLDAGGGLTLDFRF